MPYININEYDNTIVGKNNNNNVIAAIPINATDGPYDRWITCDSYDSFIQIFGPNPNPNSQFGNSWEYAANLLLTGMSVTVRRITHKLSATGENLPNNLLPDVDTAKTIVKVKDVVGTSTNLNKNLESITLNVFDDFKTSSLDSSVKGEEKPRAEYLGACPNPYTLQTTKTNVAIANAFVDVESTNSEWDYIGPTINPHFKGELNSSDEIYSMNQLKDSNGNNYQYGDFYIIGEDIYKFNNNNAIPNDNLISTTIYNYPYDLLSINTEGLSNDSFIRVKYNSDNVTEINKVWKYSDSKTTDVINYRYILGNSDVEIGNHTYKVWSNKDALLKSYSKGIILDNFTLVKIEDKVIIFTVDDELNWVNSNVEFDETNLDYNVFNVIKFILIEDSNITGENNIYKNAYYWVKSETPYEVNDLNTLYVKDLYWENSNQIIGTRSHTYVDGLIININDIKLSTYADTVKTNLDLQVKKSSNNNASSNIKIESDLSDTRLISGKFGFTNDSDQPIKIYGLKINQKSTNVETTIYDAKIESIQSSSDRIYSDSLLQIVDTINNNAIVDIPIPKLDSTKANSDASKYYIELQPGHSIFYNKNITNGSIEIRIAAFDSFDIRLHALDSVNGSYNVSLTSDDMVCEVKKYYVSAVKEEENIDYNNINLIDGNGNFNLFTAEYLYPGSNGNALNVRIKTIANQGIYLYVYRNNQYLERIELCSFRYKNNGSVYILDTDLDKIKIWRALLIKFGIILKDDGVAYDGYEIPLNIETSVLNSIYGKYIKIDLNKNILENGAINSLDYVYSLYAQTGTDVYKLEGGKNPSDEHVIHEVPNCYAPLKDLYKYDIKFVTNGGYVDKIVYSKDVMTSLYSKNTSDNSSSSYRSIENAMIDLAKTRKDCVAFPDVPYDLPLEDVPFYFEHVSTSYAAVYDPWAYMNLPTGSIKWMPPSFVQLYAHGKSLQNGNKLYLPPAGVRRAQIPEIIKTNHDLSSVYISNWQDSNTPQFVNPIIWINGFDYTIYGQKTLYNIVDESDKHESALQDLNVRLVANEIKKLIFRTCIELTFELNNIMTWNEFKSKLEPTLSVMHGEGVLTDYNVIMGTETMTAADLNSGHIVGTVRVSIARAATDWDINFELTPNSVTFTEYDYNSTYSE